MIQKIINIRLFKFSNFIPFNLIILLIIFSLASCTPRWHIVNPYENVDWETYTQYKANFHTHTTVSDGAMNPHEVVDRYHELGYDILAITDHNSVTYPWTGFQQMEASSRSRERKESNPDLMPESLVFESRNPVVLDMIDIEANELSRHHHIGSFFNNTNRTSTEIESLEETAVKNGITMLYHPGRYQGRDPETYNLKWYLELYESFDHLFGMEVYNQGDRYPQDRLLWDSVLTTTMPDRPVWGYSNDDMHRLSHLGRNWNMLILSELTHDMVRTGMESGVSYFIYAPNGHDGEEPPIIKSIKVNNRKGVIEISAAGYDSIKWISGGEIINEGSQINLNELDESYIYVRAKLYGSDETVAGTQPFGIIRRQGRD